MNNNSCPICQQHFNIQNPPKKLKNCDHNLCDICLPNTISKSIYMQSVLSIKKKYNIVNIHPKLSKLIMSCLIKYKNRFNHLEILNLQKLDNQLQKSSFKSVFCIQNLLILYALWMVASFVQVVLYLDNIEDIL